MKYKLKLSCLKILMGILLLFGSIALSSCETTLGENEVKLPSLQGLSRSEIDAKMDELGLTYIFKFVTGYYATNEYDTFIKYGKSLSAGSVVNLDTIIYIYTSVLPLTENFLDRAVLTTDYANKSFINDGIGIVTLRRAVDGDTARFYDPIAGVEFSTRFLGIDTPESTIENDPWGKAASKFTAGKLTNATTIVLERENQVQDTYNRYLAWVWVDGVLLNLELVQEAYSNSTVSSSSKYYDAMAEANIAAMKTGRRFFGYELDPDYDYS